MATSIDRHGLQELVARGAQLVEVLPANEYEEEHLPGARSVPLSKVNGESAATLDRSRPIVVYCWDVA
jgi:rhodanese-related sulfurtransferase